MSKNKQKRSHWFQFEFVRFGEGEVSHHYEVKLFVESAREGIYLIKRDYPDAFIYEVERLHGKHKWHDWRTN